MLTGGPDIPYPRGCPQDCHLGAPYAQAHSGWVPWMYESLDLGESLATLIVCGPTPVDCSVTPAHGVYGPFQLWDDGCTGGDESPTGIWNGYWISLSGGQPNSVPTRNYLQAQAVATFTQPTGGTGTGYTVGDALGLDGGATVPVGDGPMDDSSAQFIVTSISGGGATGPITGLALSHPGAYYNGETPSGTLVGTGTSGMASGGSITVTFAGAMRNLGGICQNRGAKAVAGQRYWQGMLGYFDNLSGSSIGPTSDFCCGAGRLDGTDVPDGVEPGVITFGTYEYISSPPDTKYRRNAISITYTLDLNGNTVDGVYEGSSTYTSDFTVSDTSGVNTGSGTVSTTEGTLQTNDIGGFIGSMSLASAAARFGSFNSLGGGSYVYSRFPLAYVTFSGGTAALQSGTEDTDSGTTCPDTTIETIAVNFGASTFSRTINFLNYYNNEEDALVYAAHEAFTETLSLGNTGIGYSSTTNTQVNPDPDYKYYTLTISATGTLSVSNTAADLSADVTALLAYWPLDDDLLYPWRTQYLQIMPLVSRNEKQTTMPIVNFDTSTGLDYSNPINDADGNSPFSDGWSPTYGWIDNSSYVFLDADGITQYDPETATEAALKSLTYDGGILGIPLPAGYQGYFDFNYRGYKSDYSCTEYYGMDALSYNFSNGVDLPWNTTQFTNAAFSKGNPINGASAEFADPWSIGDGAISDVADSLVVIKSAEIVEKWSAQNWGRPAGLDKFLVDETQVRCVDSTSGTLPTPTSGTANTFTITLMSGTMAGDGIWGYFDGTNLAGLFNATASGTTVTLNSMAFKTPANWTQVGPDENSWVAPARYPTAPSLLGRAAATAAAPADGLVTFTWAGGQPPFGMATPSFQETINIYGRFMNLLGTETATRIDDGTFSVPMGTDYSTAAWVTINGAPAWYFNTSYPRGKFVTLEWTFDFRTNGETARLTSATNCSEGALSTPGTNYNYANFTQSQRCLPFISCSPRVVCWTPNDETFGGDTHALVIGLPAIELDTFYGSRWAGALQSTMTDYFSHEPHTRCDDGSNVEDDGECQETATYGLLPMVEAEIWPPGTGGTTGYGFSQTDPPAVTNNEWPDIAATGDGPGAPGNSADPSTGGAEYVTRGHLMAHYESCWDYADWFLP